MGFELPNGKTARNIDEQVKYLTEKLKDLYAAFNQSGLKKIEIVDELPEIGNDSILYLVPKDDPETGDYYDEYLWIDNQWEFIGSTKLDLSTLVTTNTAQTITGPKTIPENTYLTFGSEAQMVNTSGALRFLWSTNEKFRIGNNDITISPALLRPQTTNYTDLGSSSYKWKDIYISGTVIANYIGNYTTTYSKGNFAPEQNGNFDLGTPAYKWKNLYLSGTLKNSSMNLYFDFSGDSIYIKRTSNDNTMFVFNTSYFTAYSKINAAEGIGVRSDNNKDIGDSTYRFKDLYLGGSLKDGTNTVTVAEIGKVKTVNNVSPDAAGNIAVATGTGLYLHTLTFSTGLTTPIYLINNIASAYTTRALLAAAMAGANCCCKLSTGQSIIQVDDTITKTTLYYLNGSLGITSVDITNSDTFTDTVTPYQQ